MDIVNAIIFVISSAIIGLFGIFVLAFVPGAEGPLSGAVRHVRGGIADVIVFGVGGVGSLAVLIVVVFRATA